MTILQLLSDLAVLAGILLMTVLAVGPALLERQGAPRHQRAR